MALRGEGRDPVSLGLSGVVLPQLHVRVLVAGELLELAEGRAVLGNGNHGAGREVDPDPDDVLRVDAGGSHGLRHGGLEDVHVVGGHLKRPLGGQPVAGAREDGVHDRVLVVVDGAAELMPVGDTHDDGSPAESSVVDADDIPG